jgi:hypothetical protein
MLISMISRDAVTNHGAQGSPQRVPMQNQKLAMASAMERFHNHRIENAYAMRLGGWRRR